MKSAFSSAHVPVVAPEIRKARNTVYLTDLYISTLDKLIAACESNRVNALLRGEVSEDNSLAGPNVLWEHYCVSVGGPRQTGKTRAIAEMARTGDLVVSYNTNTKEDLMFRMRVRAGRDPRHTTATTLKNLIQERTRRRDHDPEWPFEQPNRIFVDDAGYTFSQMLDRDRFAKFVFRNFPKNTPTIVCVG